MRVIGIRCADFWHPSQCTGSNTQPFHPFGFKEGESSQCLSGRGLSIRISETIKETEFCGGINSKLGVCNWHWRIVVTICNHNYGIQCQLLETAMICGVKDSQKYHRNELIWAHFFSLVQFYSSPNGGGRVEDGAGAVEKLINQRKLCFYHLLIDPGVVSLISLLARHFVGLFVCQSVTSIRWHFCIFFSLLFSVFWVF